jgi:hypothetical protein
MVNRWMGVGLFIAGFLSGVAVTGQRPEPVVSAQAGWQCRTWTLESTDNADPIGPWLGTAARVEIATAGLAIAGRYALVACRQ